MFDMGFTEVVLIGVVALVVIGPERLPGVAITVGKYVGQLKRFMTNVRADVESELRTDEIRKLLASQQEELSSLKDAVSGAKKDLDMSDVAKSIDDSVSGVMGASPTRPSTEQSATLEQSEDWTQPDAKAGPEAAAEAVAVVESPATEATSEIALDKTKSASAS